MIPGLVGNGDSTKHAGELLDSFIAVQQLDGGLRRIAPRFFRHFEMVITVAGDLGQVSDTDDLLVFGQPLQLQAHQPGLSV